MATGNTRVPHHKTEEVSSKPRLYSFSSLRHTNLTVFRCPGMTLSSPYEPSFEEVQDAFERQMKCSLIGPQDIERFLDTFLPLPSDVDPNSIPLFGLSGSLIGGREKNAYADLVRIVLAPHYRNRYAE